MRVLLDDHPIEVVPPSVARAIEVGREAAAARGRIVIEVLGDGVSVSQGLLERPPADSAGIVELKLVTADPAAFVSVTLSDSAALLDDAAEAQRQAADAVLEGRPDEAIEPLQRALLAWGVVRDVVDKSARLLGTDLDAVRVGSTSASEIISGLAARLSEIKRALTERDDSALADVLAYDMPEQIDAWSALLHQLRQDAMGRGS